MNFSIKTYDSKEAQSILDYWTPERKAKATPTPTLDQDIKTITEDHNLEDPFEVDINQYPYKCGGIIFYTKVTADGTEDFYGSAQFVAHCQMILTVAHCIIDSTTGEEYTNFLFTRGYRKEEEVVEGQDFVIDQVGTPEEFVGSEGHVRRSFDFAFCRTTEPFTDWMPLQIGIPYTNLQSIGYPGNFQDGERMVAVNGTRGEIFSDLNLVQMKNNPFREGASGGAWIYNPSNELGNDKNIVVGLNAGGESGPIIQSPLFRQETIDLFNEVLDATWENPRRCN
ncbi:hypothetical protein AM499_05095 [Bacillus sp. FJAT-22090]|uniref:trypsin-like serine peptidase n=1 Tax=Bacillus sp. FJAT-22090 TaxID=1581038 RepID=UPI0006AF137A|nr:hypothetical protein [Bacillus sp. FJAT-22090]ALC85261.1 hypothetical protein AM499_05095 [Bacillus sp. FJAT-22090]